MKTYTIEELEKMLKDVRETMLTDYPKVKDNSTKCIRIGVISTLDTFRKKLDGVGV